MRSLRVLRNILTNYLRFVVTAVVGIVTTPALVHGLGDRDFGLWTTVFALTGYFGLFDQGIRPSLVRYVSRAHAAGDREDLARTISSAFALYLALGVLTMLLTLVFAIGFPQLLPVTDMQRGVARTLVLLVGLTLAVGFPLGVFGAVLSGLQRYDISNNIATGINILRGVAFVVAVRSGAGLITLAWLSLSVNLLGHFISAAYARRELPDVRLDTRAIRREALQRIASYSGWAFVGAIASSIAFQTDALVITAVLGSALVTPFALASSLIENARTLVYSATFVLSPTASELETLGERQKLHAMLTAGSRYSVLLAWPVLMGLIVFGPNLLTTWVGERYAPAGLLLTILAVASMVSLPQSTASSVLYGIGRHRGIVVLSLVAAVANLGLSLAWARWPGWMATLFGTSVPPGLTGVAMGTAVPLTVVSGGVGAWWVCRVLEMPLRRYLWQGMVRPGLACVAFLVPAIVVQRLWHPLGWLPIFGACVACWCVFALVAWRVVGGEDRARWTALAARALGRPQPVAGAVGGPTP